MSAGETLKSRSAKPIAMPKAKRSCPRLSSVCTSPSVLLLRGVVRGDRERAEADRERLAERDDAAEDRQPRPAVAERERGDGPVDLGDVAVRLPTATDQNVGLRIITPSRTAWPPMGRRLRAARCDGGGTLAYRS